MAFLKNFGRKPRFHAIIDKVDLRTRRPKELATFTTRDTPGELETHYPTEYKLIGEKYPVTDVRYSGNETDGDNVIAISSFYKHGPYYHCFDIMHQMFDVNYLGLNMDTDKLTHPYNEQWVQSALQAISAAFATQLTDIPFLQGIYTSEIPSMRSGPSAYLAVLIHYASVLQNGGALMSKFNSTRSLEQYLKNMGYNNEAAYTTQLCNLLQKANMNTVFEELGTLIQQEYFDVKWFRTLSVLSNLPSRKSSGITDAMKTLTFVHVIPDITISVKAPTEQNPDATREIFNTKSDAMNRIPVRMYIGDTLQTTYFSMHDLFAEIMEMLDPFNILVWARQKNQGYDVDSAILYANKIIAHTQALVDALSIWRTAMMDLKSFIMVLQDSTPLNNWDLNTPYTSPKRPREQLTKLSHFELVRDILVAEYTGPSTIEIDATTKKWRTITSWHRYDGIPSFDRWEGGFQIASSVRSVSVVGMDSSDVVNVYRLIPSLFGKYRGVTYTQSDPQHGSVWIKTYDDSLWHANAANRLGTQLPIHRMVFTYANIPSALARLFLAGEATLQPNVEVRFPAVIVPSGIEAIDISELEYLLRNEFGVSGGIYHYVSGDSGPTEVYPLTGGVDTAMMGYTTREFSDFSVNAVNFIKANGPIRVSPDDVDIGFVFK